MPPIYGGAEEDRTPDPLRARQVLSQLSYDPILCFEFLFYSLLRRLSYLAMYSHTLLRLIINIPRANQKFSQIIILYKQLLGLLLTL
jgi:hypothetical protein